MELSKQNILFFPRTMVLGGTENVVLQLCDIFKPLVNNIVVCSCGEENVKRLDKLGIRQRQQVKPQTGFFGGRFLYLRIVRERSGSLLLRIGTGRADRADKAFRRSFRRKYAEGR